MNIPDIVNGTYELLGGFVIWSNVYAIHKDKSFRGLRLLPMLFFSSWSLWNLYYYTYLHQWASFIGGLNIGIANTVYVGMMIYYGKKI